MNRKEIKEKKELIELLNLGTEPTEFWEVSEVVLGLSVIRKMAQNAVERVKDKFERSGMEASLADYNNDSTITAIMHNNHMLCEFFNEYPGIRKSVKRAISKADKEGAMNGLPMIMEVVTMSKKEHLKLSLKEEAPLWVFENYELPESDYSNDIDKIESAIDRFVDNYKYDEYGDIEDYDVFESELKRAILKKLGIKE